MPTILPLCSVDEHKWNRNLIIIYGPQREGKSRQFVNSKLQFFFLSNETGSSYDPISSKVGCRINEQRGKIRQRFNIQHTLCWSNILIFLKVKKQLSICSTHNQQNSCWRWQLNTAITCAN